MVLILARPDSKSRGSESQERGEETAIGDARLYERALKLWSPSTIVGEEYVVELVPQTSHQNA